MKKCPIFFAIPFVFTAALFVAGAYSQRTAWDLPPARMYVPHNRNLEVGFGG